MMLNFRTWRLMSWCSAWRPKAESIHAVSLHHAVSLYPESRRVIVMLASCCRATSVEMTGVKGLAEAHDRLDEAAEALREATAAAHDGAGESHVIDLARVGGDGA